ncbi:MAG: magnesium transporter [Ruminococcus sp.]|nr:magnesium transporter [Candidatus Copronaster equi]
MIYTFDKKFNQINFSDFDNKKLTFALISSSQFENKYIDLGFSYSAFQKYKRDDKCFRSKIEVFDNYSFGTMKIISHKISDKTEIRLSFYIRENLFLVIENYDPEHQSHDYFINAVERLKSTDVTLEKFIFTFLDNIISGDNEALENIEFELDKLEERVLDDSSGNDFNSQVLIYKKKLLHLRNYYEQLIDIGEVLYENENSLFEEKELKYFEMFISRVDRYCDNVNLLRESLVQLREAYQSGLDLKLNNTMKIFTVVTSIFLPLTLIAGWYGMNFKYMPELSWKYGYPCVIAVSVAVVLLCIYIFKKKKLM